MPDSDGAEQDLERRLATILSADVAAYSRLMAEDEEQTLRVFRGHKEIFEKLVAAHRGRVFNTAGDAILAEFGSAVEAMRCATEIQAALRTRNDQLPPNRQVQFRIGVNLGDVMVQEQDLLGDGVNVAARLQSAASPGGVCISGSVYDQIRNRLSLSFKPLGDMRFKNIPQPVRTFSIVEADGLGELPSPTATPDHRGVARYAKWLAPAAALLLLAVGGGVFWAYSSHQRRADEVTQAARSAVAKDVTDRAPPRAEAEPQKSVAVQPAPPPAPPAPAPAEPPHPPAPLAAEAISTANDGVYVGPICFGATATLAAHCLPIKATLQQGRLSGQWPGVEPGITMYLSGDVSAGGHVTIHVHGEKADGTQQAVIDFGGMLHDGVLDATGNFANGRTATLNWRLGGEGNQAAATTASDAAHPHAAAATVSPTAEPREAIVPALSTSPTAAPAAPATPISAPLAVTDGRYGGQICFGPWRADQSHCFTAEGTVQQGKLSGQWPGLNRNVTFHMNGDVSPAGRATIQMRAERADRSRGATINLVGTLHDGRLDAAGAFLNGRAASLNWRKY